MSSEWRCACLTLLVITCLLTTLICPMERATSSQFFSSNHPRQFRPIHCQSSYFIINAALLCLLYVVYLVECWNSPLWMRSSLFIDVETARSIFDSLRSSNPIIWWHVTCYHYNGQKPVCERNVDLSTDEHAVKLADIDRSRVVTAQATQRFDETAIHGTLDMSRMVGSFEGHRLVQCRIKTKYLFADEYSRLEFMRQKRKFLNCFEDVDMYMETRQEVRLAPHQVVPDQLFIAQSTVKLPIIARQSTFIVAALCVCSFPLRLLLHLQTSRLNYTIHKVFGANPSSICRTEMSQLCRISTDLNPDRVKTKSNNEAIVLMNRGLSTGQVTGRKRWQLRANQNTKQAINMADTDSYKIDVDDGVAYDDNDDDDELLSLDIRYQERLAGGNGSRKSSSHGSAKRYIVENVHVDKGERPRGNKSVSNMSLQSSQVC